MLQNISTYTTMGFFPFNKNDKVIFLEKFNDQKMPRKTLRMAYNLYCKHRQRNDNRNQEEILGELKSIPELSELSQEQRMRFNSMFIKRRWKRIWNTTRKNGFSY